MSQLRFDEIIFNSNLIKQSSQRMYLVLSQLEFSITFFGFTSGKHLLEFF